MSVLPSCRKSSEFQTSARTPAVMTEFWDAVVNESQNVNISLVKSFFCMLDTPYVTARLAPDGRFLYFVFGIFTKI